eukprot:151035-Chlamydomonas_euryale.AAC.3
MPPTWSRRHPGSRGLPHAASADCSARALSSPPPPRPTPTVGAAGGGTPPASAALSLNICCCCSTAGKASAAEPMPGGRGTSAKASPRAAPAPSPAPPAVAVAWLGCAPGEPRASCCCAAPAGKRGLSASPMCSAYAFPRAEGDSAPSTRRRWCVARRRRGCGPELGQSCVWSVGNSTDAGAGRAARRGHQIAGNLSPRFAKGHQMAGNLSLRLAQGWQAWVACAAAGVAAVGQFTPNRARSRGSLRADSCSYSWGVHSNSCSQRRGPLPHRSQLTA